MQAQVIDTTTSATKVTSQYLWNANQERFEVIHVDGDWEKVTHIVTVDAALTTQEIDKLLEEVL